MNEQIQNAISILAHAANSKGGGLCAHGDSLDGSHWAVMAVVADQETVSQAREGFEQALDGEKVDENVGIITPEQDQAARAASRA